MNYSDDIFASLKAGIAKRNEEKTPLPLTLSTEDTIIQEQQETEDLLDLIPDEYFADKSNVIPIIPVEDSEDDGFIVDVSLTQQNTIPTPTLLPSVPVQKEVRKVDRGSNPFKRGPRKSTLEKQRIKDEQMSEEMTQGAEFGTSDDMLNYTDSVEALFIDEDLILTQEETVSEKIESISSDTDEIDEELTALFAAQGDEEAEDMYAVEVEESEPVIPLRTSAESSDTEWAISVDPYSQGAVSENDKSVGECSLEPEKSLPVDEDLKFVNCVYKPGMTVEDYLKHNKDYREPMYLEHFFDKKELNRLLVSGKIFLRKGIYKF